METHGKFESYLVVSSDIDLESAIRCASDLGSADKVGDTASLLRQEILCSFNLTTDLHKITNRSMNDFTISKASLVRLLSVTLSLFGIFIFCRQ
jgi:hypothetical protein